MGIRFYPYIWDKANSHWDIPNEAKNKINSEIYSYIRPTGCTLPNPNLINNEPNPNYDPRINLHLCASDAIEALMELGYGEDILSYEPVPIDAFRALLTKVLRRRMGMLKSIKSNNATTESKVMLINFNHDTNKTAVIFQRLSLLAQAAKEYSATHIGWR